MMPQEIKDRFPKFWMDDNEKGGKNLHEEDFLKQNLKSLNLGNIKTEYLKITNLKSGQKISENLKQMLNNDLVTIVYNFVDMLSHSKSNEGQFFFCFYV